MEDLSSYSTAFIAAILGLLIAAVTMVGVVNAQVAAGNDSIGSLNQKVMDYGTNLAFRNADS